MKRWFLGSFIALAVGIVGVAAIAIYGAIGQARGEVWGSLNGPEPIWPSVIGFGALNLIALSALAIVILLAIAAVKMLRPR